MKKILILGLVAMVGLMSSCSKENPTTDNRSKGVVTIEVISPAMSSTKATEPGTEPGTEPENKIENLKIFVLVGETNTIIEKLYDFDPSKDHIFDADTRWNAAKQSMEMGEFANPDQMRAIYTVANWKPANIDDYQVGNLSGELFKQITTNLGESASPFVMSGYQSAQFTTQSRYEIKLVRQPIKVEMTVVLDAAFVAAYPDFVFGKLDEQTTPTMGVLSTPNMSRVYNAVSIKDETGFGYVNIAPKEVSQGEAAGVKSWTVSYYLYENPTDGIDGAKATKFVFRLPYQKTDGNAQTENYYTIALKTSNATAPYKTVRNTIYRVTATLLGFGSTTPTDFDNTVSTVVSVVLWDDEAYDDQIGGGSLSLNKSHVVLEHNYFSELKCTTDSQEDIEVIASDASKVKITNIREGKITTISLQAVITADKNEDTDEYATLTIKHKNLTRNVKISYQALWAKGNIIVKNGRYAIGEPKDYGLYFKVLSVIGMQHIGDYIPWAATHKYYEPEASGNVIEKSGYIWADIPFYITGADPCRLIKDGSAKWKTPTYQDFSELMKYTDYNVRPNNYREFYGGIVYLPMPGHIGANGVGYPGTSVGHDGFYWTTTINNAGLEDIDCLVQKGVVNPISLIKPVFRFGVSDSHGWGVLPENMATLRFRGGEQGFNVRCIRDKQN